MTLPGQAAAVPASPSGPVSNPTLLSVLTTLGLTTGLKLCLDPGDIASWAGSGKLLDRSGGGFDFFLGATSGAEGSDPTFNGVAGALTAAEYFSTDGGDYFTYDTGTPETWMNDIHKVDAKYTFLCWVYLTDNVSRRLAGTRNSPSQNGFAINTSSSGRLQINVSNSSGVNIATPVSDDTFPTDVWALAVMSLDFDTEVGVAGYNDVLTAVVPQYSDVPASGAASNTMRLFAVGGSTGNLPAAGSRFGPCAMWQGVALTQAEVEAVYTATRGRYGV